jgi:hypothetical protein
VWSYSYLIIYKEGTVAMLEGGVGVQDSVVRLHNGRRHLQNQKLSNGTREPESIIFVVVKGIVSERKSLNTYCTLMHEKALIKNLPWHVPI